MNLNFFILSIAGETEETLNEEDLYKSAQFMQKATATFTQAEKSWFKSSPKILEGLGFAVKYMKSCINAANRTNNKTQSIQQMASAKMTVKSMISKVKQNQPEEDMKPEVREAFDEANQILEKLINEKDIH